MLAPTPHKTTTSFRVNNKFSQTQNLISQKRPRSVSGTKNTRQYETALSKFSFMNSIKKAVKNNDVSLLAGRNRQKLRTEPVSGADSFYETAHDILIEVRRKYDDMKKRRICTFSQTQKLKERARTLSNERSQLAEKVQKVKTNDKMRESSSLLRQYDMDMLRLRLDMMKYMKNRLKRDIDTYKDRLALAKKNYRMKKVKLESLFKKNMEVYTEKQRGSKLLEKYMKTLDNEQRQREEHLGNMQKSVQEKLMTFHNQETWDQFKNATAVETLQARDNQEREWENLILANLFAKIMLNNKITIEMNKFCIIQNAFTFIKSRTEVTDCQTLVNRFLNRDEIYGELLGKVTDCKIKKDELVQEQKKLILQNEKLSNTHQQILNRQYLFYGKANQNSIITPQMKKWQHKNKMIRQTEHQMGQWVARQIIKIKKSVKSHIFDDDHTIPSDREKLKQKVIFYLNLIDKLLNQTGQDQKITKQEHSNEPFMRNDPTQKVKKESRQNSRNSQTGQTGTMNIKIQNEEKQQFVEKQQLEEESAHIAFQRQTVLRKNQKFMKDARARFIDNRRLHIQKDLKKTQR